MASERKNSEIRKSEIVAAAQKLIYRQGSEHITVRNIAREVQISEAAVYRHFKSKREIFSYLAQYIRDSLLADLDDGGGGASWAEQTGRLLIRHMSAIQDRRGISFLVLAEILSLGDKALYRETSAYLAQYIDRLKQLLSIGVDKGELRAGLDLDAAARMLFGTIQGTVSLWALSQHAFDLPSSYAAVWNVLQKSMGAQIPPAR